MCTLKFPQFAAHADSRYEESWLHVTLDLSQLSLHPAVLVIARGVVVLSVRELGHEALPSGIVIPLAGVLGAGEAV